MTQEELLEYINLILAYGKKNYRQERGMLLELRRILAEQGFADEAQIVSDAVMAVPELVDLGQVDPTSFPDALERAKRRKRLEEEQGRC